MTTPTFRPYGLWDSPILPRALAEDRRLEAARWDSDGRSIVWLEGRSGTGVLVAQNSAQDAPRDLTAGWNVRAEVGYGGGDFTVHGGQVYFVVHSTGQIYRQPLAGGSARAITPPTGKAASPVVSLDGRWVAYVHHDHAGVDRLAVVDAEGQSWPQILAQGHDFYMQPRFSPDGRWMCWIAWDHPAMPWDSTVLEVAELQTSAAGLPALGPVKVLAGGAETSVFQGEFTPDGKHLLFVSDETGWGRIAQLELSSGRKTWLTPAEVEFALPAWVQDMRTYAILPGGKYAVAAGVRQGFTSLQRIDLATGQSVRIESLAGYTDASQLVAHPQAQRIAFVGSSPTTSPRIVVHDLETGQTRVLARAGGETVPAAALSSCEAIHWESAGGARAYGLYYPPASDRFQSTGKPPLIVSIHGGPTSQVRAAWRAEAQFFATRGYAVLLVNYRGSTGYGRPYMLALRGNWGICDVEDAVGGAKHLADAGRIDSTRTVIMGGSAGGFTVLQTMVEHPEAFTAGINLFGVANQFHLASDTHKFEARYLDSLLGPLPEAADVYRARSPVFHAARIKRPLAVFQGAIDKVVPRQQSDEIVEGLRRAGTPYEYHVYEGEGHGWRKRETIEHFYNAVDSFLRRHVIYA